MCVPPRPGAARAPVGVVGSGAAPGRREASSRVACSGPVPGVWQELKATADTLRALQAQLERALAAAGLPGGSAGATLTAVLETKEARIATLERQVALLESELAALGSPPPPSLAPSHCSLYDKADPPFKRQVSFLLNDVRITKDGRMVPPPRPRARAPRLYSATTL